jgi:hypothetical protein
MHYRDLLILQRSGEIDSSPRAGSQSPMISALSSRLPSFSL